MRPWRKRYLVGGTEPSLSEGILRLTFGEPARPNGSDHRPRFAVRHIRWVSTQ